MCSMQPVFNALLGLTNVIFYSGVSCYLVGGFLFSILKLSHKFHDLNDKISTQMTQRTVISSYFQ